MLISLVAIGLVAYRRQKKGGCHRSGQLSLLSRLRYGRHSCRIVEEPKGVLINVASKLQFTYKDACVELDPHVNHDAEATQAATSAVKGVLKNAFKLE